MQISPNSAAQALAQNVAVPFERARAMPPDVYTSQAFLQQELEQIFAKDWFCVGRADALAKPGDYLTVELAGQPVIVLRGADGGVSAMSNVCLHRMSTLLLGRGHVRSIVCPYHAWTYDLDGTLKGVPLVDKFAEDPRCADRNLKPVALDVWNGFVFVHLGEQPEPLLTFLGPVASILEPYDFGGMTLVEDQTVHLDCNWKAVVDNFSELYHVDYLHPQHKRMVDCHNDLVRLFEGGHTGVEVPGGTVNQKFGVPEVPTDIQSQQLTSLDLDPKDFNGRVLDVRGAIQDQKRLIGAERGMPYERFTSDQLSDVWQYNLFPNTVLSFTPEHCWILRPRPHATDPNQCEFDKISLVRFPQASASAGHKAVLGPASREGAFDQPSDRPVRDVFGYQAVILGEKTMTDTIDQDVELLGQVQQGMQSKGFNTVFLNEDEVRIQHFHAELDRKLMASS
mgnify:CR=1 FL=1